MQDTQGKLAWRSFFGSDWKNEINVRDFIVANVTPYTGGPDFLAKAAQRTLAGIASEVAGDVDILLAPDLESGNMLAKQLSFLANADSAGLVLGARVPVVLTSRADSVRARLASAGVAMRLAHARRTGSGKS